MDIQQTLHDIFAFEQFLPGQEEVIRRLVNGKSALAVFPTGRGKSLCYQLTALHLPGLTLVVSPLMALMKDQVDFLREKKINAARLDSSLSREEYSTVRSEFTSGKLKLLYVAPERFANERFLSDLERLDVSMIVIDEAHCISEWGHNFRPDYLKLAGLTNTLDIPVSLCLTATATPKVAQDIRSSFAIRAEDFIQTGFYRSNLTLRFSPSDKPLEILIQRLRERERGATIVYVTLQATAEEVAGKLEEHGFAARPYHAGLQDEERKDAQEWFMASDQAIVVATIAFGMGIDKGNIRFVYHYNLPKSLENYTQEIGRAGRDGKQAVCELLGSSRDLTVLENFSYGDTPDDQAVRDLKTMIMNQPEQFSISISELSLKYDMRPLVVNTLLTYLELEKVIVATGPFYTTYKFIPHNPSEAIFARFDKERVEFLQGVFSCARKARKGFSLDIDEVMSKIASPRKRIVAALNYLEEIGDLELQVSGVRKGYKKLRQLSIVEDKELTARLQEKFRILEEQDIKRLDLVVDLIGHADCQTGFLLDYFGEELPKKCGHCEFCLSGNAKKDRLNTKKLRLLKMDAATSNTINEFLAETKDHVALVTTRQRARFVCGLTSPQAGRAGLHKHRAFGILTDQSFGLVKKWLEEM
jgi:ATP-dependent DNA helicase RecQ